MVPEYTDEVDCQCRRCACSIRDSGRKGGDTEFKTASGSCCGKKKDSQGDVEVDGGLSLEPVIEPEEIGGIGLETLGLDYIPDVQSKSTPKSITGGG